MPDQSSVKVNYKTRELEITGAEEFVKSTLELLLQRFDSLSQGAPTQDFVAEEETGSDEPRDLGSFVRGVTFNKASSEETTVVFVYFLTKVARKNDASAEDVLQCYEQLGMAKPSNMSAILNNLKHRSKQLVAGGSRGRYKLNIAGENRVTRLMQKG